MDQALVILDTETATFDGPPHLLELGAIRVQEGEVVDQFLSFVCPQVPIQDEATNFHGITEEVVREMQSGCLALLFCHSVILRSMWKHIPETL